MNPCICPGIELYVYMYLCMYTYIDSRRLLVAQWIKYTKINKKGESKLKVLQEDRGEIAQ